METNIIGAGICSYLDILIFVVSVFVILTKAFYCVESEYVLVDGGQCVPKSSEPILS